MDDKLIYSKVIADWDNVESNFKIVSLHENYVGDDHKDYIAEVLSCPPPRPNMGALMMLLDQDKIDGFSNNLDVWMDNFNTLIY